MAHIFSRRPRLPGGVIFDTFIIGYDTNYPLHFDRIHAKIFLNRKPCFGDFLPRCSRFCTKIKEET